jgi:hypothetical protein
VNNAFDGGTGGVPEADLGAIEIRPVFLKNLKQPKAVFCLVETAHWVGRFSLNHFPISLWSDIL